VLTLLLNGVPSRPIADSNYPLVCGVLQLVELIELWDKLTRLLVPHLQVIHEQLLEFRLQVAQVGLDLRAGGQVASVKISRLRKRKPG
jgi:hypothetical protein